MIEVVRSEEEYRALADAALDRELERAKAGQTPSLSSKAAARFLGVHVDTLGQWRRRTPPLGPPFQKGAGDSGGGANQHVRYMFVDPEEWQSARTGRTVKERRLVDELECVKQRARELEMELELQSLRDQVARMTKKVGRLLALETLQECVEVCHEWVTIGDQVVGHVLTVPEPALEQALGEGTVWGASLAEVLSWPWVDSDARDPFSTLMDAALLQSTKKLAQERSAQRAIDLDHLLPKPCE
ncbi:nucleotide-binding protein [Stenotrophomonas maltophilia]|uniref:nucleotide-binding protein n=1 Tax=Stenotrophomonas maltophilia TaxID=40324 RepID=UPI000A2FE404|nr:nucleotide-binding protein [Stenotrophomonas maltophilia]ARQ89186.1 nucleotide-binding protein [Stenotrophomonas maltophilia]